MQANYDHWLKSDLWTITESCFLLLGLEPDYSFFNIDLYSCGSKNYRPKAESDRLHEIKYLIEAS